MCQIFDLAGHKRAALVDNLVLDQHLGSPPFLFAVFPISVLAAETFMAE